MLITQHATIFEDVIKYPIQNKYEFRETYLNCMRRNNINNIGEETVQQLSNAFAGRSASFYDLFSEALRSLDNYFSKNKKIHEYEFITSYGVMSRCLKECIINK
jgi:hypothetical protein